MNTGSSNSSSLTTTLSDKTAFHVPEPESGTISTRWLGQSGFFIRSSNLSILIDPYLSDSLAKKYRGGKFPHTRMMPPPVEYSQLQGIDLLFSTHAHSDHLDPEGLDILAAGNPQCRFLIPTSAYQTAIDRGVPSDRIIRMDAGIEKSPATPAANTNLSVQTIPAAHEKLDTDSKGHHLYLGYIIEIDGLRIYHSGDCIPYPGLTETLSGKDIHLALLPVNGRDAQRASNGIPGNFHYEEARNLLLETKIPHCILHHFGMFDFNTVDPAELRAKIESDDLKKRIQPASAGEVYYLTVINGQ